MLELPLRYGKSSHSYLFSAAAKPEFVNEEGFWFYAEATIHDKSFSCMLTEWFGKGRREEFSMSSFITKELYCAEK